MTSSSVNPDLRCSMPLSTVSLVLAAMVIVILTVVLTVMLMGLLRGQGVADPIEDDVCNLQVVRTQHHHVGRAVESRGVQAVQLHVLRLGGAHATRPSPVDRYSP